MTVLLTQPRIQYFDSNGDPLSGGFLYFYEAGTDTPINTYSDSGLTSANTNPIVLNSAGRPAVDIFLAADDYKIVLKDSAATTIWTVDNYSVVSVAPFTASETVNAQTGTSYTILTTDRAKLVTLSNANAIAITIPQANSSTFPDGWYCDIYNKGAGTATLTPTTSTLDSLATYTMRTGETIRIVSDGTNYQLASVGGKDPGVNAQTGTTYTVVTGDREKLVTFSNASSIAVTLPQANTTTFKAGWMMMTHNLGAGAVTITPTTSTINGAATLVLRTSESAVIKSNGTNYIAIVVNRDVLGLDTTDIVKFAGVQTTVTTVTSTANATTIDLSVSDVFKHTFTENTTFTFSNPPAAGINGGFKLLLINDATGRTPTWPASVDWSNGVAPTLTTANKTYILTFETFDGGTIWFGFLSGEAMA